MTEYPDVARNLRLVQKRRPIPWYERPSWLIPTALAALFLAWAFADFILSLD